MKLMKSKFLNEPDGLSCWIIHQREGVLFLQVCYRVIHLPGICQERPDICSLHAFFDLSQLRGTCEEQLFTSHQWDQSLGPKVHAINVRVWSRAGGQTFFGQILEPPRKPVWCSERDQFPWRRVLVSQHVPFCAAAGSLCSLSLPMLQY